MLPALYRAQTKRETVRKPRRTIVRQQKPISTSEHYIIKIQGYKALSCGKLSSNIYQKEKTVKSFDDIRALAAGALICGAGIGVISNSGGLFVRPVCESLGFSRGGFAMVPSISLIFSMMMAIPFGRRLKKGNIRVLLLCCAAVCCSVSAGYSFCDRLWQFYLLSAVNGLAVNGISMLTASVAAAGSRFGRTVSVATAAAGSGAVSFFALPILTKTIERFGWRWGYRLQAGMAFCVLLLAACALKEKKGAKNAPKSTVLVPKRGLFGLYLGLFSANFVHMSLFGQAAPFLTDIGFSSQQAAGVVSRCTLLAVLAKPLFGAISDKFGARAGSAVLSAALLTGCVFALLLPDNGELITFYPAILSVCTCASGVLSASFAAWLFAKEEFAPAAARFALVTTAATALANPIGGFVFDKSGGYNILWSGCILAQILSFLCLFANKNLKG